MRGLPLWLFLSACSSDRTKPPAGDADSDSDTSTGSDADVDADSDSDGDGDWDAGVDAGYEDCLGRCTGGLACCENAFGTGVRGCTDTTVDVHNCLGCGVECREGQVCNVDWGCVCPAGECEGVCVDLTWDPTNCGVCGNVCPGATPICFLGSCRTCEGTGGLSCGDECPRAIEDEENCGACGVDCSDGEQCAAGLCAEPTCEDGCGRDGVCCSDPWGAGGNGCTNVEWDYFNCGACGNSCSGSSVCVRGRCIANECAAACGFGQVCCDSVWGGGEGCTTTEWDFMNCGACGVACDAGEVCAEGVCSAP